MAPLLTWCGAIAACWQLQKSPRESPHNYILFWGQVPGKFLHLALQQNNNMLNTAPQMLKAPAFKINLALKMLNVKFNA